MSEASTSTQYINKIVNTEKGTEKILGSSFQYFEDQTQKWSKGNLNNLAKVFMYATQKLGDAMQKPGSVPQAMLEQILEHGPLGEEELQFEYFGGILASSRTLDGSNQNGQNLPGFVRMLSTYQLKTHYLLYHLLKKHYNGIETDPENLDNLEIYLPYATFFHSMDFTEFEGINWENILEHVMHGLNKEELVSNFFNAEKEKLKNRFNDVPEDGIVFKPTQFGLELFMWAYGLGQNPANDFFNSAITYLDNQSLVTGDSYAVK